jgi:hypothetical protein
MSNNNIITSTTQEFLDVHDITNDMVILKDGVISFIMQAGTMNFSLLAEQEQDAVIYTYGALLNSLNFPIQINIQSTIKDATRYLRLLDVQIKNAKTRAKAQLITEYRDFVANLIRERNVLEKKFFVVIPTNAAEMGLYSAENVLPGKTEFDIAKFEKTILIERAATVLEPRRDHLIAQFNRLGLFARQLETQEIIQNFYINYNPESMEGQEVAKSESYSTPMVRASLTEQNDFGQLGQNVTQARGYNLEAKVNQAPPATENQYLTANQQVNEVQETINPPTTQVETRPTTQVETRPTTQVETSPAEQTKTSSPQRVDIDQRDEQVDESLDFSEKISPLQQSNSNLIQQNTAKQVQQNTSEQVSQNEGPVEEKINKVSQVPSPMELTIQDQNPSTSKIEVPPTPLVSASKPKTNNPNNNPNNNQFIRQTGIVNKAKIAEL